MPDSSVRSTSVRPGTPSDDEDFTIAIDPHSPQARLVALLTEMTPKKRAEMLGLLVRLKAGRLARLYAEEDSEAARLFNQFFQTHTIHFLGGGNSLNFKITSLTDGSSCVLKVENRLQQGNTAESFLRASPLRDVFSPIYGLFPVNYLDEGIRTTRKLVVTDFYSRGSLANYSQTVGVNEDKLLSACDLFIELGTMLVEVQAKSCFFSDIKLTNLLVDEQKHLCVADTKSLTFSGADGSHIRSVGDGPLSTPYMAPPEVRQWNEKPLRVEPWHVFLFGKSFYEYLTNSPPSLLQHYGTPDEYQFGFPLFHAVGGMEAERLIKQMLPRDPDLRMPLKACLLALRMIQCVIMTQQCTQLMRSSLIDTDQFMTMINQDLRKAAQDEDALIRIHHQLSKKITSLQERLFAQYGREPAQLRKTCQEKLELIATSAWSDHDEFMTAFLKKQKHLVTIEKNNVKLIILLKQMDRLATLLQDEHPAIVSIQERMQRLMSQDPPLPHHLQAHLEALQGSLTLIPIEERQMGSVPMNELVHLLEQYEADAKKVARCRQLLQRLDACGFGEDDLLMARFAQTMETAINTEDNWDESVKTLEAMMSRDSAVNLIKEAISSLRLEARIYTRGVLAKANKIETAIKRVPPNLRNEVMTLDTEEALEVRKALAWHAGFRGSVKLNPNGTVDEAAADKVYQTLKQRLQTLKTLADEQNATSNAGSEIQSRF